MFEQADRTRADVLIDVSAVAREAGIRYPVALTRSVWQRCVAIPPGVVLQDEADWIWNLFGMLCCAITRQGGGPVVPFALHVRNDNRERAPPLVRVKAVCRTEAGTQLAHTGEEKLIVAPPATLKDGLAVVAFPNP